MASIDGEYHNTRRPRPKLQGGSLTTRADYNFKPFSVGGGLKYAFGDTYGLGAVASVGYHRAPLDIDVVHTQPLSGNLAAVSDVSAKVRVASNVTLGIKDTYTWGRQSLAALTTDTKLGNVNYAVSYELPHADGAGNRARFGADTSIPLSKTFNLGLRGAVVRAFAPAAMTQRRSRPALPGPQRCRQLRERRRRKGGQFGTVLRGGLSGSLTPELSLSSESAAELGRNQGLRAALGTLTVAGT